MTQDDGRRRLAIEDLKTRSPAEYEAWLRDQLGTVENFKPCGDPRHFTLNQNFISMGDVAVGRIESSGFEFETSMGGMLVVAVVSSGKCSVASGGEEAVALPREQAAVLRPSRRAAMKHAAGTLGFGFAASVAALKSHAEAIFDRPLQIGFDSDYQAAIDLTRGVGAALQRNLIASVSEITALAEVGLSELATTGPVQLLLSLTLAAVMPSAREMLALKPSGAGKPAFDRAREYLTEHAGEQISLSDLAKDLGVSLRSLQLEFQRQLGRTPLEYLFECRLELARGQLLVASPGETVTNVAAKSGFTNLGAFAARYRETFGELPSETLSRSIRR